MQQCNFPIEIIINDDCSTDGTTEIIREYAEKYPDKIFPVFHEENLYSQGVRGMFQKFVFPKARGKYIALCEGDDYWTDPRKLQKQVDFLESHPDYSMCFHNVLQIKENGEISTFSHLENREYSRHEIIDSWLIPTASAVYRSSVLDKIPQNPLFKIGDNVIFLTCSYHGKIHGLCDTMGVYRQHEGGWTSQTRLTRDIQLFSHWRGIKESFPPDLHAKANELLSSLSISILIKCIKKKKITLFFKYLTLSHFVCGKEFHSHLLQTIKNLIQKAFISK